MPEFGFVGPSYVAPSIYQDAQECINWRPEVDPLKAPGTRGVVALYPTPGLTSVVALSNQAPVRGLRTLSGSNQLIAVCGSYVYSLTSILVPTIVGQLLSTTGQVGITDNGVNVYITDGTYRYTWRISSPSSAVFTGSISGTTLTVSAVTNGTIGVGQALFGIGVSPETVITALGTGSGGVGTYTINLTQSLSSTTMNSTAVAAIFTATISSTTLSVTAVSSGTLYPGQTVQGASVTSNTVITALGSNIILSYSITTAGTGYALNDQVTVQGGVYGTTPQVYTVSSIGSGGSVTGLTVYTQGIYTTQPISPASTTTSGSGSGLTLTLTFGTGTGGTGSYTVSPSQTESTSETMYALNFSILPSSDGAFTGADVVDIVDNYFVYNRPGTQQWAASNILSPITPALSFASKDGAPDNLVSLIVDHREVYLMGEESSEVWIDAGTYPFPFQRIPGTSTQHGIVAKFSLSRVGNSFAYLSRNIRGQAQVMLMEGYIPKRISTHAVENTLVNQYVQDAVAWTYQLEGHEVYVISFPTLDLTWAYDITTDMWHKWLYCDNTNTYHRCRGNCAAVFQNQVLVGDWQNGQIYALDPNNYTDNGQNVRRLRRAPHLVTDLQRQYFDELQIQFQPGVGTTGVSLPVDTKSTTTYPQAMLRWSNDGGSTWSREYWVTIGQEGKYKNRAIWRRLGWARDRVFEVVVTDPVKAVIVSSNLKASEGEN
jgi:hypothetical protein